MTPGPYRIGNSCVLEPMDAVQLDRDPRGVIWLWEPPRESATYCMGVDPTVGLVGWDRTLRVSDDERTDNGSIEIIRVGKDRDYQVAEFAAPIDPEELADVANALGRLYAGNDDDGQCLAIVESNNSGLLTIRRMLNEHGYTHQFVWKYLDSAIPKPTHSLGWYATPKSVQLLWVRCARHILKGNLAIRSRWLVEEMSDCELDNDKMIAKAVYGRHDDRVRAMNLAIWASHEWDLDITTEKQEVSSGAGLPEWQATDISAEELASVWNERFSDLGE